MTEEPDMTGGHPQGAQRKRDARRLGRSALHGALSWALLGTLLTSACSDSSSARLLSLSIDPVAPRLAEGTEIELHATAVYSDGRVADVSALAAWSSSDVAVVQIVSGGCDGVIAQGLSAGAVLVTARLGLEASTPIEVSAALLASIEVFPSQATLAESTARRYRAVGTFSNARTQDLSEQVVWGSSDPLTAALSSAPCEKGLVLALTPAATAIEATLDGVSGSAQLTVSAAQLVALEIAPLNPTLARGTSRTLTATGLFSDQSTQDLSASVVWSSTNPSVASVVDEPGSQALLTAVAPGTAEIGAAFGALQSSSTVSVSTATPVALEIAPANPALTAGLARPLTATATFSDGSTQDVSADVLWSSDGAGIAAVSNARGLEGRLTALSAGSATIRAALGAVSVTTPVNVSSATLVALEIAPLAPTLAAQQSQALTAIGTFSDSTFHDVTTSVAWSSSDALVAVVSNALGSEGLWTAVAPGMAEIRATLDQIDTSTPASVSSATLVALEISPSSPTLAAGLARPLTATGTFSDLTTQDLSASVTWASADTRFAVVSNASGSAGLLTAVVPGSTEISATLGPIAATTSVSVSAATLLALEISPTDPALAAGLQQALTAIGTFTDSSTQDLSTSVTWSSDAAQVAVVSNASGSEGRLTGVGPGLAQIGASLGSVATSMPVSVSPATLVSLAIEPAAPSSGIGQTLQLTALGTFTDSSVRDLTASVTWASSSPLVVLVSNATGFRGRATALLLGSSQVSATLGSVSDVVSFDVGL